MAALEVWVLRRQPALHPAMHRPVAQDLDDHHNDYQTGSGWRLFSSWVGFWFTSNCNTLTAQVRIIRVLRGFTVYDCYSRLQQGYGCICRVESLFFGGMKGEVWIQPGKLPSQVGHIWGLSP